MEKYVVFSPYAYLLTYFESATQGKVPLTNVFLPLGGPTLTHKKLAPPLLIWLIWPDCNALLLVSRIRYDDILASLRNVCCK